MAKAPTKAEQRAAESVRLYAELPHSPGRESAAWEAVNAISRGMFIDPMNTVWVAHFWPGPPPRRELIPLTLGDRLTLQEVAYRYGYGPKPAADEVEQWKVELAKARNRARLADDNLPELRRRVEYLTKLAAEIGATVEAMTPLPESKPA